MIRRKRKVVHGIEITLLEKSVGFNTSPDFPSLYADLETKLKQHLTSEIHSLPTQISSATTTQLQNLVTELSSDGLLSGTSRLNTETFLGLVSNDPEDGSLLSYDDNNDELLWAQSPSLRIAEIENTLINYTNYFTSEQIQSNKFHIPFAVKWSIPPYHEWGGRGKAGIFWSDPWANTVDNYSIKMGGDNWDIGETGYSNHFPISEYITYTGTLDSNGFNYGIGVENPAPGVGSTFYRKNYAYKVGGRNHTSLGANPGLVQRFANDNNPNRGWAWTKFGPTPNKADSEGGALPWVVASLTNAGLFNTEGGIISNKYNSPWSAITDHTTLEDLTEGNSLGAIHVAGYKDAKTGEWSGHSIISIGNTDLTKLNEGWVLTYEHHYPMENLTFPAPFGTDASWNPWTDTDEGIVFSYSDVTVPPAGLTATTSPVGHLVLRPPQGGALSALTDVQITTPTPNGDSLIYNTSLGKWINGAGGGGGGGGTLPGVEIDMGAFLVLEQPAEIDAGSFV